MRSQRTIIGQLPFWGNCPDRSRSRLSSTAAAIMGPFRPRRSTTRPLRCRLRRTSRHRTSWIRRFSCRRSRLSMQLATSERTKGQQQGQQPLRHATGRHLRDPYHTSLVPTRERVMLLSRSRSQFAWTSSEQCGPSSRLRTHVNTLPDSREVRTRNHPPAANPLSSGALTPPSLV